uniref:REJ domain-containing protein n=1 Tax=Anopheles merus TaxID=30066 RepID=A0A182V9Z8_ANOME
MPESKSSKRPQSIISVSSSSSGSSSVSTGTSSTTSGCEATTVSVSGNSNSSSGTSSAASNSGSSSSSSSSSSSGSSSASSTTTTSITTAGKRLTLSITDPNAPAPLKTSYKKHQRSTTLVSQCSMESGIIADISLSPDEVLDNPHWPHHHPHHHHNNNNNNNNNNNHHLPKHNNLKKTHSLASSTHSSGPISLPITLLPSEDMPKGVDGKPDTLSPTVEPAGDNGTTITVHL